MIIKDAWLPAEHKGKRLTAGALRHFGIVLTIGRHQVYFRDRCGDRHWAVYDQDNEDYGEEFRRFDDAVKEAREREREK